MDRSRLLAHGAAAGRDLVACTDSMVFVYTSRGYLRTWSVSGVQQSILSPCGHVVSMVGSGSQLCLVYEDSYPLEGLCASTD